MPLDRSSDRLASGIATSTRLESWKEIAAYLHRSVSTVQRWEAEEGLPVHRLLHAKAGTVYALTGEIDAWRRGRDALPDGSPSAAPIPIGAAPTLMPAPPGPRPVAPGDRGDRALPTAAAPRGWQVTVAGAVTVGLLVLAVGSAAVLLLRPSGPTPPVASVAVLPFSDLSSEPEEWFADGLTEGLITELSRVGAFEHVINMRSVLHYRGSRLSTREIARELGVDAVVTGAVLRAGPRVRITAQLSDARRDRTLWAGTYERDLSHILLLQDDLVRDLTRDLHAMVSPAAPARSPPPSRVDPAAYQLYLRGLAAAHRYGPTDLAVALRLFDEALAIAPTFAPAHAASAVVYFQLPLRGGLLPWHEAAARGRRAAALALTFDDTLAEAHSAAAGFAWADWEWPRAERLHRRALELNPHSALARVQFAHFLVTRGRYDEAVAQASRAVQLDPADFYAHGHLAWAYYNARRHQEAVRQWRIAREMSSRTDDPIEDGMLALALAGAGALEDAMQLCEGGSAWRSWCAVVFAAAGRNDRVRGIARHLGASGSCDVELQVALGNAGQATDCLERAYAERYGPFPLLFMRGPTIYEGLKGEPRYHELLRRLELPE
jgi:TolB-like protein/tetratricopeptide (TPR) repeat protein